MMVKVRVIVLATGATEQETEVNFNRFKSRAWLDKLQKACFANGRGVQLWSADAKEPGQ